MQKIQFASYNCFRMAVPHCGLILVGKNLETLLQLLRYFHLSSESFLFSGEKTVNLKTSSFYGVSFHEAVPGGEVHTMKQIYPAFPSYSSFKLKKKKSLQELLRRRLTPKQEALSSPMQSVLFRMGQPGHGIVIHINSLSFCGPRKLTCVVCQKHKPQHS